MDTVSLTAKDVHAAVPMSSAIDSVRQAFLDLAAGHFEQPVRTAMREGQFLVMSVHHRPSATAMVKTLSVDFDRNPAIVGTVTWVDTNHAQTLVADAGAVTTLRTGAICGVATDLLAPAEADRMALIGAGGQAADQVRAVHAVRPLRSLTITDRDPAKAHALADQIRSELPFADIQVLGHVDDAVQTAHIVTCATTATEPVLSSAALPEHVHVNAIGAFRPTMRELPDDLLAHATVVIDDYDAIMEESGEILHAIAAKSLRPESLIPLGHALTNPPTPASRTVFKTVGVAAQDWAIAGALAAKHMPTR